MYRLHQYSNNVCSSYSDMFHDENNMCHDALSAAKQQLKDLMEQHERHAHFILFWLQLIVLVSALLFYSCVLKSFILLLLLVIFYYIYFQIAAATWRDPTA